MPANTTQSDAQFSTTSGCSHKHGGDGCSRCFHFGRNRPELVGQSLAQKRKKCLRLEIQPRLIHYIQEDQQVQFDRSMFCLSLDEIRYVTSLHHEDDQEQRLTLLLAAVKYRRYKMAWSLVHKYHVNVNQCGTLTFANERPIREASVLWCACAMGQLHMVRMLVEHGALVNMRTATESTPLRPACFEGHLNIVRYLLKQGADANASSVYYKNTNLMVACYQRHTDVVKCLLEHGVKVNDQDFRGRTAFHIASEMGCLPAVQLLLRYGCEVNVRDNRGTTALQVACEHARENVVLHFLKYFDMDFSTIIETKELLGASIAQGSRPVGATRAISYMKDALLQRQRNNLPKTVAPNNEPVFNGRKEFNSLEELNALLGSDEELMLQSYLVKQRLMNGITSDTFKLLYHGAIHADAKNYSKALVMWEKALYLHKINKHRITDDVCRLVDLLYEMKAVETNLNTNRGFLDLVLRLFAETIGIITSTVELIKKHDKIHDLEMPNIHFQLSKCPQYILCLLDLLLDDNGSCGDKDLEFRVKQLIYKFCTKPIKIVRNSQETLLHLACTSNLHITDMLGANVILRLPNLKLIKILLECGADPNAVDASLNTPLHFLTEAKGHDSCVQALLDAGANMGFCNANGRRPMGTKYEVIQKQCTLKVLAAVRLAKEVKSSNMVEHVFTNLPMSLAQLVMNCAQPILCA